MPDIKIRIQADSASAIKELEKLSSSSDNTAKSLTKLSNEMVKASAPSDKSKEELESLSKIQKQYLNAVDRAAKSYEITGTAAEAYRKQISLLSREYQKMAAIAPKSGVTAALGSRVGNAQSNLNETLKKEAELQNKAAKAADVHTASLDKQDNSIKKLAASFLSATAIWDLAVRLITKLGRTFKEAAELAAEAEETMNLFNVTFENTGHAAQNAAIQIASSLGISASAAQQALGMFGSLAQGYGETQAASLAFAEEAVRTTLDLISFRNITGDVNTVMSEFSSGLVGNYENFRKWGIVITANEVNARLLEKGLSGLTGEALQLAKIQETLNIVQERSSNAMGDMERTLDSTANVSRRVTEANKELLENMGEGINKVLTPLKRMWLDIVDTINKASRAQEEFASGSKDIKVYDIRYNKQDRKDFTAQMAALYGDYFNAKERNAGQDEIDVISDEILAVLTKYAATAEDVASVLDSRAIKQDIGKEFMGLVETASETMQQEREYQRALEARQHALEESMTSAQHFFDSLSSIPGVRISQSSSGIVTPGMQGAIDDSSLKHWQAKLSEGTSTAIEEAIASLDSAGWETFISPIEKALGIAGQSEGFKGKLESYEDLYEAVYNQHLKDGKLTEEEKAQLDAIVERYKEVVSLQQSITAEKQRQQELESAISSMTGEGNSYERKLLDLSDKNAVISAMPGAADNIIDNEIARQSSLRDIDSMKVAAMALSSTEEELEAVAAVYQELYSKANEYYDSAKAGLDEDNRRSIEAAYSAALGEAGRLGAAYPSPVFSKNAGAQSLGADLYENLQSSIEKMVDAMEKAGATDEQISGYVRSIQSEGMDRIADAVSKEEERQNRMVNGYDTAGEAMLGGMGEIGELINAFSSLSSSAGGLLGILINLASQTELVSRLSSFLSETVLPVLNAFLAPLLPMLEVLSSLFQNLIMAVLAPAFPVIKALASMLTIVFGLINIVVGFIYDSVRWVVGWIMKGVLGLVNGVIDILNMIPFVNIKKIDTSQWEKWADTDVFGNAEDRWNEMQDTLEQIADLNMEIADNTSDSPDLSVYNDLLAKGLINASEYSAMVSEALGKNYDNVLTYGDGSYWTGANGSTNISSDNISIVINGDGLDSSEIAQEVIKELNNRKRKGGALYA